MTYISLYLTRRAPKKGKRRSSKELININIKERKELVRMCLVRLQRGEMNKRILLPFNNRRNWKGRKKISNILKELTKIF